MVAGSVYAGVDARAAEIVDRAHWLPRKLQYPFAAVRALATFTPATYSLVLDGTPHRVRAATVVVANSATTARACGSRRTPPSPTACSTSW